ncbi:short-chain dehydrogenase [Cladorrhinum sp. PSN259]|nr:short-chain dehydrogenase [Cladorrhinum sp. PSN259]
MDPITALGLAAAILQFVEIGSKIVQRLSEFSADVNQVPKSFRQVRTELPLIVDGLRRINEQVKSGALEPTTEAALVPVITECLHAALQLNDLLDKTLPSADASTWERRKKALSSLAKDKKVDDLGDALGRYLRVLTFHQVLNPTPLQLYAKPAVAETSSDFFWLVPFDRNPSFVGRDAIFQSINRAFDVKKGSQPKAALFGLGGIGKSQIALEYCYRRRLEKEEFSVFWVNAATASRFEESFKRIATECSLANRNSATSDGVLIVQEWLQSRHKVPWVMVVDNVDDEASFFHDKMSNGKTPSQCIPRCSHGSLLFTTRTRDIAVDLATSATPITIAGLSEFEGLQLIKERLEERYRGDDDVIGTFLAELEYIPLAITQALAFILKRRKTIAHYLEQYRKSEVTKSRLLSFEFADHGRQDASLESIVKTWSLSFDWIRNTNPRAAKLLCLVSFFQHQGIPRILLSDPESDSDDDDDLEDALGILRAYSFLDTDEKEEIFDTHRLIQIATKWWLEGEGPTETGMWAYRALRSVARHFPKPVAAPVGDYWAVCESLLPHADLVLKHQFKNMSQDLQRDVDLERARLLAHTGRYLPWAGAYNEASVRLKESVSIREEHLGERAIDTLTSMRLLLWVLGTGGMDVASGVELGERLLALCTEELGDDHPDTIDVMSELATALHNSQNQETRSETLHREAVMRSTRVLGRHHMDTLNCMASLASILEDLGHLDEAVELMREVCPLKRRALGEKHPDVLANEQNLAMMLMRNPELEEEALTMIQHVLEVMTETMGFDHRETLVAAHNRIYALINCGETDEALALCGTILAACEDGPRRNEERSQEMVRMIEGLKALLENDLEDDDK